MQSGDTELTSASFQDSRQQLLAHRCGLALDGHTRTQVSSYTAALHCAASIDKDPGSSFIRCDMGKGNYYAFQSAE